jgi:hypothetical protein
MKPFDLEKALAGEKVITRDGQAVSEIVVFKTADFPLAVVVDRNIRCYVCDDGTFNGYRNHPYDLFMAPKDVTMWTNVYPCLTGYTTGQCQLYKTEQEAKDSCDENGVTTSLTFSI